MLLGSLFFHADEERDVVTELVGIVVVGSRGDLGLNARLAASNLDVETLTLFSAIC